jgi:hypothetical protein
MTEDGMVINETFCGTSSPIDIAFQPIVAKKYLQTPSPQKPKCTIAHRGFQIKHEIEEAESRSSLRY